MSAAQRAATLTKTERLARIAALHAPIRGGHNHGFCDGCEDPWPCQTRLLADPTLDPRATVALDLAVGDLVEVLLTGRWHPGLIRSEKRHTFVVAVPGFKDTMAFGNPAYIEGAEKFIRPLI